MSRRLLIGGVWMLFLSKRLLAGVSSLCLAVSSLAVEGVVVPQIAHALSADCASFSLSIVNGNGVVPTGNFTFEAGEQITFNIIIPPGGGTVRIQFLGIDQQTSSTGSLTFTVPNTGPTSTGAFIIDISGVQVGEAAQISGVCAGVVGGGGGAANDENASAVVVDAAVLGVLPGGQGGGLKEAFGVNLSAAIFEEAFRRIPREPEPSAAELLEEEIARLDFELERLFSEVSAIDDTLSPPRFGAIEQPEPLTAEEVQAFESQRDEISQEIRRVRAARDDAIDRRDALARSGNSFAPVSSGATEPTSAVGVLRNGFTQRVDLADVRRAVVARRVAHGFFDVDAPPTAQDLPGFLSDERFNAWLQASVTFHSVDGNGRDEDGSTVALAGGVSYLFGNAIEAGLVGRYARSQRDGTVADTDVDLWSLGAFAQTILDNGVSLQAVVAGSFGDGSVVLDPAATRAIGAFDVRAYQAQIRAAKRFEQETWWIEPDASLTVTHMTRDGFAASDGTAIPETRSTRLTAALGPTVGTDVALDGGVTLSPYLGVTLFGTLVDQPDRNTPLASSDTSLGGGIRAGLQVATQAGATVGVDGSVNAFEDEAFDVTVSARVTIPFGG